MRNRDCAKISALVSAGLLSLLVSSLASAADIPKSVPPTSQTAALPTVASGAVEDSLQACMARIPKEATIGQRMVAEQSCQRDQSTRGVYLSVPGR